MTQQMLNPLTKLTKAQSHDSHKYSNQNLFALILLNLICDPTKILRAFVALCETNSYFSGEGIDFMLGALDLLVARGRDDLRVVRYCSREG